MLSTAMRITTRLARRRRPRAAFSTTTVDDISPPSSATTPKTALEEWSENLTNAQMDKLIDELMKTGRLSNDLAPDENRRYQQEILRQLAGQSLLRDNATGWDADASAGGGSFLMSGSSPISVGWEGIEEDLDVIQFPGYDDQSEDGSGDAGGANPYGVGKGEEEEGDEDAQRVSLLFIDRSKDQRTTPATSTAEQTSMIHSVHDDDVLAPGTQITAEDFMSLPDVYQTAADLSMWSFLKKTRNIDKTVESYTDCIAALFHHGDWRRARALFDKMELEALDDLSLTPSVETYNVAMKGLFLSNAQNIDEAIRLYDSMPAMGYERDAGSFEAVIEGLLFHDRTEEAFDLFWKLHYPGFGLDDSDRNDGSNEDDDDGDSDNDDDDDEDDFQRMLRDGDENEQGSELNYDEDIPDQEDLKPNSQAEKEDEDYDLDLSELDDMTNEELDAYLAENPAGYLTTRSYNLVLKAMGTSEDYLDESWLVFTEMGDRVDTDVETYNIMLQNLFLAKDMKKVEDLWESMPDTTDEPDRSNMIPNRNQATYDIMLDGYAMGSNADANQEKIQGLLNEMTLEKGLQKNTWPFLRKKRKEERKEPFYQKMKHAW
jgi:pentatricopeptide repeat protein